MLRLSWSLRVLTSWNPQDLSTPVMVFLCLYVYMISRSVLLRMRNISDKNLCSVNVFRKSCRYEIMWKNVVDPDMEQVIKWRVRSAWWIPKAKNTHSDYVIFIGTITTGARMRLIRTLPVRSETEEPALLITYNKVLSRNLLGTIHINDEIGP
jgi:hypothetical protein